MSPTLKHGKSSVLHNKKVLSKLEPQPPISARNSAVLYKGCVKVVNVNADTWLASIDIDNVRYNLGTYKTQEKAGIAHATAYHHFVTIPERQKLAEMVNEAAAATSANDGKVTAATNDGKVHLSIDKYDNDVFFEDGRQHHSISDPAPELPDETFFTNEFCRQSFQEMNKRILECEDSASELLQNLILKKSDSVLCRDILSDHASAIRKFYEKDTPRSMEELEDYVREVTGGEDKGLSFFLNLDDAPQRSSFPTKATFYSYMRNAKDKVGRRMVLYLGRHCFYCGKELLPDHADKWWAYTYEHLSILGTKDADVSALDSHSHLVIIREMMKCVPACRLCNPIGDEKRNFPVDRFYPKQIIVVDDALEPYQSVSEILDSTKFQQFCAEARDHLNLDYAQKVDDNGVPVESARFTKRVGTFVELKLLVWKHYPGVLLEDIVLWRRMSDYVHPRYAFRTTVVNLVKALTNTCPGSDGNDCTGWRNLRNLSPWQYAGIHFDHNGGDGRAAKSFELCKAMNMPWEKFLEELAKCLVLCSECHKCD